MPHEPPKLRNLLADLPEPSDSEAVEALAAGGAFRLKRIVSTGQATPPGQWYDQDENEWVAVLSGSAALLFEGDNEPIEMRPGDYLHIPAHRRHRVERTDVKEPTVWLALYFRPDEAS